MSRSHPADPWSIMFEFLAFLRHPFHNWHASAVRDICLSVGFLVCLCIYVNLYVFLHPFSWMLRNRHRARSPPQRRSKKEHRWQHDLSHVRNHRRSLSYYIQQEQSSFLEKLPLEIRQEIYTYVLCGRVKHFARLGFNDTEHPRDFSLNGIDYRTYDSSYLPFLKRREKNNANMLALILTCHQIYTEAVDIVYKSPVFKVSRLFTLHDLFVTLPAQRFSAIRHLELSYEFRCGLPMVRNTFVHEDSDWQRFWTIAATKMPSLRDLKVDLFNLDIPSILSPDKEVRRKWLVPILQVKDLMNCNFKLHHVRRMNVMMPHEVDPVTPDARAQLDRLEREISRALISSHDQVTDGLLSGDSWYETT